MGLLDGKKALIFGVANKDSIAWGIARMMHEHGATLGFSSISDLLERRVRPLAESIGSTFVEPCDVQSDEQIAAVFEKWKAAYGDVDILVHALAFAPREAISGAYLDMTREDFRMTLDISAYSLTALVKAAQGLLPSGSSVMAMTYYGSQKAVPHYNVMGVAKAALEASVRYLAVDMGPRGVRVNAISAGPVRTLSAMGVADFRDMYREFKHIAPLRQNITPEDVGKTAVWLASDLSSNVTGEVVYVDGGVNVLALATPPEANRPA